MENKFKITVPKPCHEDWNSMTPDESGRFCSVCTKAVVDFTNKTTEEIQQYFIQNEGQKVCGRFRNEQVNKFDIQIPQSVLRQQMSFQKSFLLTLFIVMGTSLFSCKNHNDATLGDVCVVEDTVQQRGMTTGMPVPHREFDVDTAKIDLKRIYPMATVQDQPSFIGGIENFYKFISSNLKISEQNKKITGKIIVSFVVEIDGELSDIKIIKGINEELNSEVIRVFKSSSAWTPGKINDQKVRVSYLIPIKITSQI